MKIAELIPVLCLAAAACAHAPAPNSFRADPEAVEAEGSADFDVRDLASTKARAVQDAEKAAVRRTAGLFMDDEGSAASLAALENGPLKNTPLYVARHKVLAEGQDGALYRVSLRVWVYHDRLAAALRGLNLAGASSSRRALLAQAGAPEAAFSAAFRNAFSRRSQITVEDLPAGTPPGQDEALRAAAAEGADLLFFASASASQQGGGINTGFFPSRGEASLKVIDAATGAELLQLSSQANAVDPASDVSRAKALASAGEMLAQEAAVKTARLLKPDNVMRLKFYGLRGLADLEKLKGQLQKLDIRSLRVVSYASGNAVFEVSPRTQDPQEFASAVLRGDSMGLELEGSGAQEAEFALPR